MKHIKKLRVAMAVASMFAVADMAMAASISQSGVTVAREVISTNAAAAQTLRAPTVSFNYTNGPTANAFSTQDFSVSLQLGGNGTPTWSAASVDKSNNWRTVNAKRQSDSSTYVVVGWNSLAPGGSYLRVLDVVRESDNTLRYYFRLENPTAAAVSLSDLALEFNAVNATTPPVGDVDYVRVATLQNSINPIVGSTIGTSGDSADACGNADTRITVRARNFIGSGASAPEGETSGQTVINNGYILFAQALNVRVGRDGYTRDRQTDPTLSNQQLTPSPLVFGPTPVGTVTSMPLGFVAFSNVPSLSAWDTSIQDNYYQFSKPGAPPRDGDLGTLGVLQDDGDVDTSQLRVVITSTNGFASGASFSITNNPFGNTGAAAGPGTDGGAAPTTVTYSADGLTATLTFNHAALVAAAQPGVDQTLLGSEGLDVDGAGSYVAPTDRFYINYIVPGNTAIPLSGFTAQAYLDKELLSNEQTNISCVGPFAGLGGGVKIDVRNFFPWDPANPGNEWVGVIRVINNDESVPADLTGQYIRADGKYGKWGSLGTLEPRGAIYFTNKEIHDKLVNNAVSPAAGILDNSGAGGIAATGGEALPRNTRLRISSNAASTLRVQSYIYNATTRALVEVSASQGADFINVEASPRDHVDQDAQTGIKK